MDSCLSTVNCQQIENEEDSSCISTFTIDESAPSIVNNEHSQVGEEAINSNFITLPKLRENCDLENINIFWPLFNKMLPNQNDIIEERRQGCIEMAYRGRNKPVISDHFPVENQKLQEFFHFYVNVDGRKSSTVSEDLMNIARFLKYCNSEELNLLHCFNTHAIQSFVLAKEYFEHTSASSIIKHLNSIRKCQDFMIRTSKNNSYTLSLINMQSVVKLRCMDSLIKRLSKLKNVRSKLYLPKLSMAKKPNITKFSKQLKKKQSTYCADFSSKKLSSKKLSVAIGVAAATILDATTNRSGLVTNLQLSDIGHDLEMFEKKGKFHVCNSIRHKTGFQYNASICLTKLEFNIFSHYIKSVRPQIKTKNKFDNYAFVTSRGYLYSNVSQKISTVLGLSIAPTDIRKSRSNSVMDPDANISKSKQEVFHKALCHRTEVAKRHYSYLSSINEGIMARNILKRARKNIAKQK